MVSIEQTAFFQRLRDSPLEPMIQEITSDKVGNYSDDTSNASNVALNLLIAVKENNSDAAKKYVQILSKRRPTKESHWIYDNYLLFSLVTAIAKFGFETAWVSEVINLSLSSSVGEDKKIKETFKNILAGNLNAKNDFHQISMLYQSISGDEQFQVMQINSVFSAHWMKPFPYYEDDFLNLSSLRAIEIAVEKKSLLNAQQQYDLDVFLPTFNRRADLLANIISWLIVISLMATISYALVKLNDIENDYPDVIKTIFFLIGLSGVGILGIIGWKKGIARFIRKIFNSFFRFKHFDKP